MPNEALNLVRDLVLPIHQILDGISAGQNFPLPLMLVFVDDICKMKVCTGQDIVKVVFGTFGGMTIDILKRLISSVSSSQRTVLIDLDGSNIRVCYVVRPNA